MTDVNLKDAFNTPLQLNPTPEYASWVTPSTVLGQHGNDYLNGMLVDILTKEKFVCVSWITAPYVHDLKNTDTIGFFVGVEYLNPQSKTRINLSYYSLSPQNSECITIRREGQSDKNYSLADFIKMKLAARVDGAIALQQRTADKHIKKVCELSAALTNRAQP